MSDIEQEARQALREVLPYAHANLYKKDGNAWRQIIASFAFGTKADLSLIQHFCREDQGRFHQITQGFINGDFREGEIRNAYLEFFPKPEGSDWILGGPDEG